MPDQLSAPVTIYAAASLDGYLAPPDGSVGWLSRFDDGTDLGYDEFFAEVGSSVVGRTTFEQVRTFGPWPYAGIPTVVLTRQSRPPELPDAVTVDDGIDLPGLVKRLRDQHPEGAIWLLGGGQVHRAFLAAGLVDDIWLHVMPVLLGEGISMFPGPFAKHALTLTQTRSHPNGVVLLRYQCS